MKRHQVKAMIKSLQLYINNGVGTCDELEDAEVQLSMYLDIYDEMNQE
tara:strand:- start:5906 stop:6049 length:144 start_codon:yes stop_codon:yes gene_type:complete